MEKRILNKIAKDWCKGILLSNDGSSFDDIDDILNEGEIEYILECVDKIANRITEEPYLSSMDLIIKKYYKIEIE